MSTILASIVCSAIVSALVSAVICNVALWYFTELSCKRFDEFLEKTKRITLDYINRVKEKTNR